MTPVQELAVEVAAEDGFKSDLARLQSANLRADLGDAASTSRSDGVDVATLTRLLQSAMIFTESDDPMLREVAQRISTAALRLAGSTDPVVGDLFALIQGRLRNFPAILAAKSQPVSSPVPLSLQYEFFDHRARQSILVDGAAHVLTPFQLESWRALTAGRSTTLSGPTSAGKSYVLLQQIVERLKRETVTTIVYVVPTRALINQVSDDLVQALSARGIRDVTISSVPVDLATGAGGKTLYVLTQERLDALLIASPAMHIDLVVVDEAQILSVGSRGILLEAVIDRISARDLAMPQFVFCGPMIQNARYFGEIFRLANYASCVTTQSPVTQNIIRLDYSAGPPSEVIVRISGDEELAPVTKSPLPIRLLTDIDKLSYLSAMFGRTGSSIVYAAGKADAEKIAIKVAQEVPASDAVKTDLAELIAFVKKHVHKDYALVGTLERGVGFHYGHMPSLLRKELEDHFKARRLSFMICTSTLLYGLNLPAKNIFLHKPTTGRGVPISGPDFWNLAGRAGRLGKELEGNVFLINYDDWETKPVAEAKGVMVNSSLKATMIDQADALAAFLDDTKASSETNKDFEITLGKLVLDHRLGRLDHTIDRYQTAANQQSLRRVSEKIIQISDSVTLPIEVLNKNIGVSVFRQQDLLTYMVKRLKKLPPGELVPAHPLIDFESARNNYVRAFKRIHTYLLGYASKDKRHYFFSGLALRWMRGDPLPQLIDAAIRYNKDHKLGRSTATIIRETMEDVEDHLRFRYVKFFTCYNSILEVALNQSGHQEHVSAIPNIPLFLEMGGSSGAMINLMALGLSRTSAESITEYITDKDMGVDQLRGWLLAQNLAQLDISPACIREIEVLRSTLQGQAS